MISYREAQDILQQHVRSFGQEAVSLDRAPGRVLAGPVFADRDYPPFDRATMDGYAIRSADLGKGMRNFTVVETVFAGATHTRAIAQGECYKIMTGAPVPEGLNIVLKREDTIEGDAVMEIRPEIFDGLQDTLQRMPVRFLNIARRGEDLRAGEVVIDGPCMCTAPVSGLLATLGEATVMVERLPRVALLTTGNEVVGVDEPVNSYQIRNSNRWFLQSALKDSEITPVLCEHLADRREQVESALERALDNDMVILSGGVSAGDADFVPGALAALGVEPLFYKIAMKPGKPVWCGMTRKGAMVFALPGNPFSCLVGYTLLIRPWLHGCFGLPAADPLSLPLRGKKMKKTPLDEFFPVRISGQPSGVEQVPINGSGDIRLGLHATALALHPASSGELSEGVLTTCYPL